MGYSREDRDLVGLSIVIGERSISALAGLPVVMLAARFLETEAFGQPSLALSIVAVLGMLSQLGLDTLLLQRLVEAEDSARRMQVLRAGFLLRSVSGLAGFGLTAMLALLMSGPAGAVLALVAVPLLFNGLAVAETLLLARGRVLALSAARPVSTLVQLAACCILVCLDVPHPWFESYWLSGAVELALILGAVLACGGARIFYSVDGALMLTLVRIRSTLLLFCFLLLFTFKLISEVLVDFGY